MAQTAKHGFRYPNNDVTIGGEKQAEFYTINASATVAECLPGVLVKIGAKSNEVVECDASGNAIGFLGYQDTAAEWRPETVTTAYAVGDRVAVLRGAGRRQMGYLASGQSVAAGEPLARAASGQLTAGTIGTDDIVGDSVDAVNATTGAKICWITTRK